MSTTWNPNPPVTGAHRKNLYNRRRSHPGGMSLKAPTGHKFMARIVAVNAALAQSVVLQFTPDYLHTRWESFGQLGGDGMVGKTPTDWLTGDIVNGSMFYSLSTYSWYFGRCRQGDGVLTTADEYENGILLHLEFDDAGMWQNGQGPDYDFNDLIVDVWVERHAPPEGWHKQFACPPWSAGIDII